MLIRPHALFDGEKMRRGFAARIENGLVAELGEVLGARPGEEVLDAPDCVLSPGFVDIHIHGIENHDTMHGEAHVRAMARSVARHGVTGFLPTTMAASVPDTRAAVEGVARAMDDAGGARVLGCHLEGPFLNAKRAGAQPPQFMLPPTVESYNKLTGEHAHVVRLMTLAPELPGADAFIAALKGNIALSAGHTDATCEETRRAAELGVTQVTHMFNGMNPLTHRAPGVPGAALVTESLSLQLIADLIHLHPDALRLCYLAKRPDRMILITDAMEATDMPDGEYTLGANRVIMRGGEARLPEGALAGSTLTMDRAVQNMVSAVQVPVERALQMATANPAESVGLTGYGRIAPGGPADLVLLSGNLSVERTIVAGETVYVRP